MNYHHCYHCYHRDNENNDHDDNNDNNDDNSNDNVNDDDETDDETLKLKEIIKKYYLQNSEISDKTSTLTGVREEKFANLLIMTELINTYNAINDVAIYVSLCM